MAAPKQIIRDALNEFQRDAKPYWQHPLKILHVAPHQIERLCGLHLKTKERLGTKFADLGKIQGGDWDLPDGNPLLVGSRTDWSVRQHYLEGVAWDKTPIFKVKLRRIQEGRRVDGCSSLEELQKRYERLDRVSDDMAKHGFRIMRTREGKVSYNDLISVSFTRHGDALLGAGGKHRLAIAKLMNLSSIPVIVLQRHELWQSTLQEFFSGVHRNQSLLFRHPDLQRNVEGKQEGDANRIRFWRSARQRNTLHLD